MGTKSPGILQPPKSEKKRARMMADKTPEGPTPRKRKPATRARSITHMLQALPGNKENQDGPSQDSKGLESTGIAMKNTDAAKGEDASGAVVTTASMKSVKAGMFVSWVDLILGWANN